MALPGGIYSDPIPLSQYLSTVGDGTGVVNAVGDYTATTETFFIQPAAGEIFEIEKLLIHIVDSGALPATVYGGLGAALDPGINIVVTNEGSIARSVVPGLITANDELQHVGNGGFALTNFTGGIDAITATLDFVKIMRAPLILDGDQDHKLEVILDDDDFTGLVDHHFIVHGRR